MNYINKGKRDILIFPKFKNIDKIQEIRKKYDELAEIKINKLFSILI